MRISDWSSDVCSSDLIGTRRRSSKLSWTPPLAAPSPSTAARPPLPQGRRSAVGHGTSMATVTTTTQLAPPPRGRSLAMPRRSEEHTSELQSLMRISYAVFCLKKKKDKHKKRNTDDVRKNEH